MTTDDCGAAGAARTEPRERRHERALAYRSVESACASRSLFGEQRGQPEMHVARDVGRADARLREAS